MRISNIEVPDLDQLLEFREVVVAGDGTASSTDQFFSERDMCLGEAHVLWLSLTKLHNLTPKPHGEDERRVLGYLESINGD